MQEFNFYLDQKETLWYRTKFSVEASSIEEAKEIAIQKCKEGLTEYRDYVDDTQEALSVQDNGGKPTEELFMIADPTNDIVIWDNTKN
jgi:phosphoribulokinase